VSAGGGRASAVMRAKGGDELRHGDVATRIQEQSLTNTASSITLPPYAPKTSSWTLFESSELQ
jgi:hypothetical protein